MQRINLKNNLVVGVDITRSGINLVEMSFVQGTYWVQQVFRECYVHPETSIRATANDEVLCLRRALLHAGIQAKQAIVAVPDVAVMTNQRVVPRALTDYEMETLIRRESELAYVYPNTQLSMDFQIIGPVPDAEHLLQVLVVEAKLELVNQRVEVLKKVGLQVMAVDTESHAMARALRYTRVKHQISLTAENSHAKRLERRIFLIHLELLFVHLFVFRGREVLFTREERWSQSESLDSVLFDVQGLIDFFLATGQQREIDDEWVLSGEPRHLTHLQSLLAVQMGVRVQIADPLRVMPVNSTLNQDYLLHSSSALLQACGLALWGHDEPV